MNSDKHFHFIHKRGSYLRTRRETIIYKRLLSNENYINTIQQQIGYQVTKRGYKYFGEFKKKLNETEVKETDPLFKFQWFVIIHLFNLKRRKNKSGNLIFML